MLWKLPGQYTGFNNLDSLATTYYNDAGGQSAGYDKFFQDIGLHGAALDWARKNEDQFTNAYQAWANALPVSPVPLGTAGYGNVDPETGLPYKTTPGSYFTAWLSQYGGPMLAQYNYLPARQRGVNTAAFQPSRLMF